jgi:hypothetical protein
MVTGVMPGLDFDELLIYSDAIMAQDNKRGE